MSEEKCWVEENLSCILDCNKCQGCSVFINQFLKIVYCKEESCLWFKKIAFKKFIEHSKGQKFFGDEYYTGVCSRSVIGVNPWELETKISKHKKAICNFRSDKYISNHLDFSRFPQGGNIPDPITEI